MLAADAGSLAGAPWRRARQILPLTPSLSLRPQWRATRRTTASERWMLRLSQTISQRMLGAALAQQAAEKARKILFGPGIADHAFDLAGGDIEGRDQGLSAVAAILELTPLDLARRHRQSRRDALQSLNAGHLVDGDRATGVIGGGRSLVDRADVCALGIEGGIGLRGQPVADAMRLEVGLFFKKRPTERCEMLGMRPRRMASSAISRWLQWLIGRRSPTASRMSSRPQRRLLGRESRRRSRARRIGQPLGDRLPVRRLAATACANTVPSSARRQAPVRSRAHPRPRPPVR